MCGRKDDWMWLSIHSHLLSKLHRACCSLECFSSDGWLGTAWQTVPMAEDIMEKIWSPWLRC